MDVSILAAVATGLFGLLGFFFTKHLERKAVSTALLAEVRRLLRVIAEHRGHWEKWMTDQTTERHPLFPFSCDVYKKHIGNLGLVSPRYVGSVVQFYGYVNFINTLQNARERYATAGAAESFNHIYQAALTRVETEFGRAFDDAFRKLGLATL